MGMLLRRHRVKQDNPPKLTTLNHVTPKPKVKKQIDYRGLDYNSLKTFAKERGVDLGKYRKKDEIIDQLDKILG
jgi:membrane-bound lytic murein transglycosylase MltF